ncbi:Uncharacterised protein [Shigella sonnei]|nr:Uncharacterised protein [Shigella sonnei]
MVEVINGVNLALCIAVIGARRAGRLQIPFSVALAQLLPQAVKNVPRLNVKGSAIFIDHGQEHLTDKLWIGGRRS